MLEDPRVDDDYYDDLIDPCFENSQVYEDGLFERALTDGANEFLWSDAYERAFEKRLENGDEE